MIHRLLAIFAIGSLLLGVASAAAAPGWLVAIVASLPAAAWLVLWRRKGARAKRVDVCPTCGYDLRATPERCPECGCIPAPIGENS